MSGGWATYLLLFASYAILTPYLQLYFKARGFSTSSIGLLLGVFELAGIAGPILVGLLADRLQRYRRFVAASFAGSVLCFALLETTTALPACLAITAGFGFCYRSAIPLLDALVGRTLPDPARQYGTIRVAGSVGFITVSLLLQSTGWVSGDDPRSILVSFSILAAVAALSTIALPAAPSRDRPGTSSEAGRGGFDARFWLVIGVIFTARFAIAAYYSFFSLFLRQSFGLATVSAIWALGTLAEIPTILFSGRLIARFGLRRLLGLSVASVTVRLTLYGLFPVLGVVVPAQLLHAFTFGTLHTTSVAYVNVTIDPRRRGLGMAAYNALGVGLASFLASGAGGYLVEAGGFRLLFLVYAAVPLAGLAALAVAGRFRRVL